MRPRIQQADEKVRLTTYGHIIHRYLRYVLIRCTGYTNDKSQVQRMAVYALVTACLLFDKLTRLGRFAPRRHRKHGEDSGATFSLSALRVSVVERKPEFPIGSGMT